MSGCQTRLQAKTDHLASQHGGGGGAIARSIVGAASHLHRRAFISAWSPTQPQRVYATQASLHPCLRMTPRRPAPRHQPVRRTSLISCAPAFSTGSSSSMARAMDTPSLMTCQPRGGSRSTSRWRQHGQHAGGAHAHSSRLAACNAWLHALKEQIRCTLVRGTHLGHTIRLLQHHVAACTHSGGAQHRRRVGHACKWQQHNLRKVTMLCCNMARNTTNQPRSTTCCASLLPMLFHAAASNRFQKRRPPSVDPRLPCPYARAAPAYCARPRLYAASLAATANSSAA